MTSRRSFLQMLAGGAALALTPMARFIPSLEPTIDHLRGYATFSEMVTATLNSYRGDLAANLMRNNALLDMLMRENKVAREEDFSPSPAKVSSTATRGSPSTGD